MSDPDTAQASAEMAESDIEAVRYLRQAILGGTEWYVALLEAISRWESEEESHDGRTRRYLIAGEAFDWLALAERLCQTVDGLLPEYEKVQLLFHGRLPADITPERFRDLIGSARYRQYLNYYYGVTVEEALLCAVRDEVRKERMVSGFSAGSEPADQVYHRVYGAGQGTLLAGFRGERRYPHLKSTSLLEMKEFTYWLFRYRLRHSDRERVASDTKKALDWLRRNGAPGFPGSSYGAADGDRPG